MITELHQDSPMALQPPECSITFYRHQLTLLKRAQDMESTPINLNDENVTHPSVNSAMRFIDRNATNRAANAHAYAYAAGHTAAAAAAAATPATPQYSSSLLRTSIGVIGDKVGAGKSYVILGLALNTRRARISAAVSAAAVSAAAVSAAAAPAAAAPAAAAPAETAARPPATPSPDVTDVMTRSFADNRITMQSELPYADVIEMTVIVIPHTLSSQWTEYMRRFGGDLAYMLINRRKHFDDPSVVKQMDVIIVTATFYNQLAGHMRNCRIRRVVFDEADSMSMTRCQLIDACFHWFATASYRNMQCPSGDYTRMQMGIRSTGFINNVFTDLTSSLLGHVLSNSLVIKNSDEFVDASMQLPEPVVHMIRCRQPIAISVLQGVVDRTVIQCLNAGDVSGAMQHINPANRGTENNIVALLIGKLSRMEHNLAHRIAALPDMFYDSEALRASEETRLNAQLGDVQERITNIRERIAQTDTCCICYEELLKSASASSIETTPMLKTVVPCCSNSYCFMCINRWLESHTSCPMCKSALLTDNLLVVTSENEAEAAAEAAAAAATSIAAAAAAAAAAATSTAAAAAAAAAAEAEAEATSSGRVVTLDTNGKIDNLEIILRARLGTPGHQNKVLLFTSFDNDAMLERMLAPLLSSLSIRWRFFKGNEPTTRAISRDYRTGTLDMIVVNVTNYASGLNCENTTDVIMMHKFDSDIEHQVIGRAQRLGRTCPLNIWHLLFDNEITSAAAREVEQ